MTTLRPWSGERDPVAVHAVGRASRRRRRCRPSARGSRGRAGSVSSSMSSRTSSPSASTTASDTRPRLRISKRTVARSKRPSWLGEKNGAAAELADDARASPSGAGRRRTPPNVASDERGEHEPGEAAHTVTSVAFADLAAAVRVVAGRDGEREADARRGGRRRAPAGRRRGRGGRRAPPARGRTARRTTRRRGSGRSGRRSRSGGSPRGPRRWISANERSVQSPVSVSVKRASSSGARPMRAATIAGGLARASERAAHERAGPRRRRRPRRARAPGRDRCRRAAPGGGPGSGPPRCRPSARGGPGGSWDGVRR